MPVILAGHTSTGTHVIIGVKLGINPLHANQHDSDFIVALSEKKSALGFMIYYQSN